MAFLIVIVVVSSCIQLYFWLIQLDGLYRSYERRGQTRSDTMPSVTLIVAIKDEVVNLQKNVSLWLEQDYPALDIIIVDDHSTDGSLALLKALTDDRLQIIDLPKGKTTKKWALSEAIAQSKSEWIITTDADCQPVSNGWISSLMVESERADVILGYSPHRYKGDWLASWIDYETWYIAIQYLSASLMGRPYMSVARNLAFRKEQFDAVGGFNNHLHVRSGDDDLLINEIGSDARYALSVDKNSWVWTEAKSTWSAYFQQKRRHLSTAPHYNFWNQVWLMAVYMSQFIWYASVFCLILIAPLFGLLLVLRWLILMMVAYRSKEVLELNVSVLFVPIFDLAFCMFYGVMSFTMLQKNEDW